MEFLAKREALIPTIGQVTGVVERRLTLPILGHMLLKANDDSLELTGTDLEIEIRSRVPVTLIEPGTCTIPARKMADICRALPDDAEIRFRIDGEKALVTARRSRFSLLTLPAPDFPQMETPSSNLHLRLTVTNLKYILEKTAFAMAQQDVRYYLNGLLLVITEQGLIAVATDGHRMAKAELETITDIAERKQIIIPGKTVHELKRLITNQEMDSEIDIEISERTFRASFGSTLLTSKLVDGRYPDYERVIPINANRAALVNRDGLRQALMRTAILSNEKYKGVRFQFERDLLRLQTHNPEQEEAEEELEIAFEAEPTTIGFNVSYVTDVLNVIAEDDVEIVFIDGSSSSVWRGKGHVTETFVIMPMRL